MNNTATLSAEEYADQVIEGYRVFDDADWADADRAEFVTDEVVRYICRTTEIARRLVKEESVRTMVEGRLAAARR
jgi:hypothetical protein